MKVQYRSRQRGLSFLGLLFIAGLGAVLFVVGAQVVPTFIEYQAIDKAVNKAREGNTVAEARSIFDKAAAIDNISTISGKDIEVTKAGDKVVVSYAYQREIHLAGPAFLTLKYAGRSK
jgi:hypothetical protein